MQERNGSSREVVARRIGSTLDSKLWCKLLALVYDSLPSTTAVFSYAIGSRKLSANEQFFVGRWTIKSAPSVT